MPNKFLSYVPDSDGNPTANRVDLENQVIYIYDYIDSFLALEISNALFLFKDLNKVVLFKINSFGGSLDACQSIITDMTNFEGSVQTDITGVAYSAAAMVALMGDNRRISKVGSFMLHYPKWGGEEEESLPSKDKAVIVTKEIMHRMLEVSLGASKVKLGMFIKKCGKGEDWHLTPDECLKLKLVDEVY